MHCNIHYQSTQRNTKPPVIPNPPGSLGPRRRGITAVFNSSHTVFSLWTLLAEKVHVHQCVVTSAQYCFLIRGSMLLFWALSAH